MEHIDKDCRINHPPNYKDPESLQEFFPHLSKSEAEKLARLKARPFTKAQTKTFLLWYTKGMDVATCVERAKSNHNAYLLTKGTDRSFAKKLTIIEKGRKHQVEAALYRYATGRLRQTKSIFVAVLDKDSGEPVLDENGKQKFFCSRKEVTELPAHPQLVTFFLRHRYPEIYAETGDTDIPLSPDEIEHKLDEAAKKFKIKIA